MHRRRAVVVALAGALAACGVLTACGVRAPATVDTAALLAHRGPDEARRELVAATLANPRDVGAHLALAELDDRIGRPSEALAELETVVTLGGPLGTRWHDADRARFARLLHLRGMARFARGSGFALADLERARSLGVASMPGELSPSMARSIAELARAIELLRHIDAGERAKGRELLELVARESPETHLDIAALRGARKGASAAERGDFGDWAWNQGARREAYEQLAAWHAATPAPRDAKLEAAYLRAVSWWTPVWLGQAPLPPAEELVGAERCLFPLPDCPAPDPVLLAPPRRASSAEQPSLWPPLDLAHPRAAAAARYAASRGFGIDEARLSAIALAYDRSDRARETVDRLGRDLVAQSIDAAAAFASLGALFDALGDPGRARAAWQAAVDRSPEPAFVRGLAEAAARAGDAPAALVFATQAAAAHGDPATVWTSVAAALDLSGHHVDALVAARNAIDLAGPDVLPHALDIAIAASIALDRLDQIATLRTQRARFGEPSTPEARLALATYKTLPTAATLAHLWVVSRAQPDLELRITLATALDADDPRRATVLAELAAFASDADPTRALAAIAALPR